MRLKKDVFHTVSHSFRIQALLLEKDRVQGKTSYFVIKLVEQFGYIARIIHKLYPFRERFFKVLKFIENTEFLPGF